MNAPIPFPAGPVSAGSLVIGSLSVGPLGWTFVPHVYRRKPTRVPQATAEAALPRWAKAMIAAAKDEATA
jgi:hypothetical protein